MKNLKLFTGGILAGIAIAIGAIAFLSLENKIIGAIFFAVGLSAICLNGLNLYTGKVCYLFDQPKSYLLDLLIIFIGNFVGTWLGGMAVLQTRAAGISEKAVSMCETKNNDSLLSLFILGIFCGMLVYIAVEGFKTSKSVVIIFMAIACFIISSFEHCIADMAYYTIAGMWNLRAVAVTLVVAAGNSVGGVLIPLYKKMKD